jgi:hypothetical protein
VKIILPKDFINLSPYKQVPLFFLAGPIRGGGDWQNLMCHILEKMAPGCIIAVPSRWEKKHFLNKYKLQPEAMEAFDRQLDWERHYLEMAAERHPLGCIIFWLGCQKEVRTDSDPYAMDTRGELGEWRGRMISDGKLRISQRVVVGAEEGFPGLSQIKRNFDAALGFNFPIHQTMEDTARAALQKL